MADEIPKPHSDFLLYCSDFFLGIFFLFYRYVGWDTSMWFSLIIFSLYSAACVGDIYKYFFLSYLVEAVLYEEEILLHYRKGESRRIPYTEIGFVDFRLHEGIGSRIHFSPHFSFYKKNSTSKILDSVLHEKDYFLFGGVVDTLEDYLRIKEILEEKGKHCVEPRETRACFQKNRLTRQARLDIG